MRAMMRRIVRAILGEAMGSVVPFYGGPRRFAATFCVAWLLALMVGVLIISAIEGM